jgi:hypothetical protein
MRLHIAIHTSPEQGPTGYRWLKVPAAVGDALLASGYDRVAPDLPGDSRDLREGNIRLYAGMASVDREWSVLYRVLYGGHDSAGRDCKVYLACGFFRREEARAVDILPVLEEPEFAKTDEGGGGRGEVEWSRRLPDHSDSSGAIQSRLADKEGVRKAMANCLGLPLGTSYRVVFSEDQNAGWSGTLVLDPKWGETATRGKACSPSDRRAIAAPAALPLTDGQSAARRLAVGADPSPARGASGRAKTAAMCAILVGLGVGVGVGISRRLGVSQVEVEAIVSKKLQLTTENLEPRIKAIEERLSTPMVETYFPLRTNPPDGGTQKQIGTRLDMAERRLGELTDAAEAAQRDAAKASATAETARTRAEDAYRTANAAMKLAKRGN